MNTSEFAVTRVESEFIKAFDFEVYDIYEATQLVKKCRPYVFGIIGLYLLFIYFGQRWMRDRAAFELKTPLVLWNAGLAIFSVVATIRMYPETAFQLSKPNGIYQVVCARDMHNFATAFWGLMFTLSKILEFGDTVFIVLRKRKLIFLHWYHHILTLLIMWFGYESYDTLGRLCFINTFVHSFMYTYYALRALNVKIPKKLTMCLTTLQIVQMVLYFGLNLYSLNMMRQGYTCKRSVTYIYWIFIAAGSFFVLFCNYFMRTFLARNKTKPKTN